MAPTSLVEVASAFQSASERLHDRFLEIRSDEDCANCRSAAFGEAILTAWVQTAWGEFTRELLVSSALGAERRDGTSVRPLAGVETAADAEQLVKETAKNVAGQRGLAWPVWHAPWFAVLVSTTLGLENLQAVEAALGATLVPGQITTVRNALVHPGARALQEYEVLRAKLGMLDVAPEYLPRQLKSPGVAVFTSWVRELQSVADDSIR